MILNFNWNPQLAIAWLAFTIEQLCNNSGEPVFCKTILTADPRTKNASIFELGLVAIDLALNKSYSTKVKIQSLNESTGDPKLKDSLAFCEAYYEDASYVLGYARSHLNNKQYEAASISAGGVNNDARKCERKLNNPPVKSPFTKENQDLERLSAIIATAANIVGDGQLQSFSPQASVSSSMFPFYFIYHSSYSSID